jgi:putative DNA primase/helicase
MKRKSFKIAKSSNMQWQDVALRYEETDFVRLGEDGRIAGPLDRELPSPRTFPGEDPPVVPRTPMTQDPDDDLPL